MLRLTGITTASLILLTAALFAPFRERRPFWGAILILAIAAAGLADAQGKASGTLAIGKDTFDIHYAAATVAPDPFDKNKINTRIVLTDKPTPPDMLDDSAQIDDLKSKGYHGLLIEIAQDKSSFSASIISSTLEGSLSSSGTFDAGQLSVFTNKRVEGVLHADKEERAGVTLAYHIQFACDVMPPEAAPTPADEAAAKGKESTKAYLTLVAALRSGDKQTILGLAPPDQRAMFDTPQFPEMLKMAQAMMPQNIHVLKVTETGDRAKLLARGVMEGHAQRGKIYMTRLNGKWVLATETWSPER